MSIDRRIIKKIDTLVNKPGRVLICSHRDPDGDSLGCQLAYYEYLRRSRSGLVLVNDGELPEKYRFMDPRKLIKQPEAVKSGPWAAVVVFECSSLERVGRVAELFSAETPLINIDHHSGNRRFGTVNWVERDASACGEMVYQLIRSAGAKLTRYMADLLLATILTDTGRFHYQGTSAETMRVVAELMDLGADLKKLTDRLYFSYSEAQFRFINQILSRADIRENGRICVLKLRRRDSRKFGVPYRDLEGLVDQTLSLAGVRIGALLREMKGGWTKISLRSTGGLSILPLARHFCGGGHANAAGCQIDQPLSSAVEEFFEIASRYLADGSLRNSSRN